MEFVHGAHGQVHQARARGRGARFPALSRRARQAYLKEETQIGLLVWDGETCGLHRVRDTVLKAPEDEVELAWQHRNAQRGEVDICINFRFDGEIPPPLFDAL